MEFTNNTQIRTAYSNYLRSNKHSLRDCYDRYSWAKHAAYNNCMNLFNEYQGENFRIIGHNSNQFSCGFTFTDKEVNDKVFAYITKDYIRFCPVKDLEA